MPPGPVTGRFWARKEGLRATQELKPRGEGTAGFEGQRSNTPAPIAKIRSGQAILIFFNSRRTRRRKNLTACLSLAWPGLNYTTAKGVLILRPSTPSIAPSDHRQLAS